MTQQLIIRPETIHDYAPIAAINARAFNMRYAEPHIIDLLRHRTQFDPQFSLVAELNGALVGHVLFSPFTVRLLGQNVRAVILAPIAIDLPWQKQGIGSKLIAEGHASARAKGYALAMLVGHPTYYPRFGYQTSAYGSAQLIATPQPDAAADLQQRAVHQDDVPALCALWDHEEGAVDFALRPSDALMEWLSPNTHIKASVYVRDGAVVGYTRILSTAPAAPRIFLARDADAARGMVALIAAQANATHVELPLHPASSSAAALGIAQVNTFEPAMAMSLMPNPFDEYLAQLRSGTRTAGRVLWPVEFDVE
jgi:putative acetyltransferase